MPRATTMAPMPVLIRANFIVLIARVAAIKPLRIKAHDAAKAFEAAL